MNESTVLLTCGLGDFVAIEGWLTPEQKAGVRTILWGTRAEPLIRETVDLPRIFPGLTAQHSLHRDWCSAEEWNADEAKTWRDHRPFCLMQKIQLPDLGLDWVDLAKVSDWSIVPMMGRWAAAGASYLGSAYDEARQPLGGTGPVVIHPFSSNALADHRDFTAADWQPILKWLRRTGRQAYVVGTGRGLREVPVAPEILIDRIDQWPIARTLEALGDASHFIGCASALSVFAAKWLPADRLCIKGHISLLAKHYHLPRQPLVEWHRYLWQLYYPLLPHVDGLLVQQIGTLFENR